MLCVALFCDVIMVLVFEINNGYVYAWRVFLTSRASSYMYYMYIHVLTHMFARRWRSFVL